MVNACPLSWDHNKEEVKHMNTTAAIVAVVVVVIIIAIVIFRKRKG